MADHSSQPHVVDECRGVLFVYSDGSVVRLNKPSFDTPIHDDGSVSWKDVMFDDIHKLELRLYKPTSVSTSTKLPVFYYIHGGGYCIGSRTWPNCQNFCLRLAKELQAVVVSPDYRLAPENRLPAAIDDGFKAMKWLQEQALGVEKDGWLSDVADFDRVFVAGDSAGGNIAHHLGLRLGAGSPELAPVRVRGYVHLAAFFGGAVRTKSEADGPKDSFLNLDLIDRYWRLSLPVGETTDHSLVNPFGPNSPDMEAMDLDPTLAIMGGHDLLRDRVREYVQKLRSWGKKIEYAEFEGKQHGFFALDPYTEAAKEVVKLIKNFIIENSAQTTPIGY